MNFTPSTIVHLLNTPLESDNKNQLTFASQNAQTSYFLSCVVRSFTDFTYQRKEAVIRVPVEADLLYNCNYVMFDNINFLNKWFYAFIEQIEYINPNCSAIHIKLDSWQTWQFALTFKRSFVVRQHSQTDNFAGNLESEPLSVKCYAVDKIGLGSTDNIGILNQNVIMYFSKIPSAVGGVNAIGLNSGALTMQYGKSYANMQLLKDDIDLLEQAGELDLVNDIGIGFFGETTVTQDTIETNDFVNPPFTPKNQKTLSYCYGVIKGSNEYKITVQELLKRTVDTYTEIYWGSSPFAFAQIRDIPNCLVEYTAFPIANVTTSTFENSIMHSLKEQNTLQKANFLPNILNSFATTPKPTAAAGRSVLGEFSELTEQAKKYNLLETDSIQPDSLSGFHSPSAVFAAGYGGIYLIRFAPTAEQFSKIDEFFTKFGYAYNKLMDIHFTNRPHFDYIETNDINIIGEIPNDDMNVIKRMFNSGVTFWHNPTTFGDYSQNNAPV